MQSSWNDDRVEQLTKLWSDGLSASQIAGRLGHVTRNAVISKVHRLGLSGRVTTSRNYSKRKKGATKPRPMHLSPEHRALAQERIEVFRAEPDIVVPENERRKLLDLEAGDCRWPIGDPRTHDFHFCNRLQIGTESRMRRGTSRYCQFHFARAFDPPRPRRYPQLPATATVADKETV